MTAATVSVRLSLLSARLCVLLFCSCKDSASLHKWLTKLFCVPDDVERFTWSAMLNATHASVAIHIRDTLCTVIIVPLWMHSYVLHNKFYICATSFILERKFCIWDEVLYLRGSFIFERKYYICGAVFYIGWDIFYVNDYMFYKCDMNYYMLKQVLYMRKYYICGAVSYISWDIFYVNDYTFYKCDTNYYMLKQVLYMRHKYYWNKRRPINNSPYYITTNDVPNFGDEDANVQRRIQVFITKSLPCQIPGIDCWIYDHAMDSIA